METVKISEMEKLEVAQGSGKSAVAIRAIAPNLQVNTGQYRTWIPAMPPSVCVSGKLSHGPQCWKATIRHIPRMSDLWFMKQRGAT